MERSWLGRLRLWALLRRVAGLRVLEGAIVGPTARQGVFHRLISKARRQGSEDDFRTWLLDPSASVRALGLVCLVQLRPDDLYAGLRPVLADGTIVRICPCGCRVSEMTLSQLAMVLINTPGYFGSRTSSPRVS